MNSLSPLFQLPNTYRAFYGAFEQLYPAQKQAILPILTGKDVILQAKTGSGKTEAVLVPCLERVIQAQRKQAVLYTKARIPRHRLPRNCADEKRFLGKLNRFHYHEFSFSQTIFWHII